MRKKVNGTLMSMNLGECETELYFPANELNFFFFFYFELSPCYITIMISVSSGPGVFILATGGGKEIGSSGLQLSPCRSLWYLL